MKRIKVIVWIGILVALAGGCQKQPTAASKPHKPKHLAALGPTVIDVGRISLHGSVAVEGYGLVADLPGTGTTQCPERVKAYLTRFVRSEVPDRNVNIEQLIDSPDTAVVYIKGVIPAGALVGDLFDLQVQTITPLVTTSLEGGWMYAANLSPVGVGIGLRPIARVTGASGVFVDKLTEPDPRRDIGYVLGGARVLVTSSVMVALDAPDFRTASVIRNQLGDRFGGNVAIADNDSQISLTVPARYRQQRWRFYELVESMFLSDDSALVAQRVQILGEGLGTEKEKRLYATHLEAIGQPSVTTLETLLESSDDTVRLEAAHCLFNLGNSRGLRTLVKIAREGDVSCKVDAVEAIAGGAGVVDVVPLLMSFLPDENLEVALAAYKNVVELNPQALLREQVDGVLGVDMIVDSPHRVILAQRSGQARILLMGGPLMCQAGHRLLSADGMVTLDTTVGKQHTVMARKLALGGGKGPVMSSRSLVDVIQVLCLKEVTAEHREGGLSLPYADLLVLLKQMCESGMVDAELRLGPLPSL